MIPVRLESENIDRKDIRYLPTLLIDSEACRIQGLEEIERGFGTELFPIRRASVHFE
jgi:hypothetical protein